MLHGSHIAQFLLGSISMRNIFLLSFLLLINTNTSFAVATPAETLLNAFGAQCPAVVTRHVQGSIINVNILSDVAQTLRDSENCLNSRAFSSSMRGYQSLYEQYAVFKETEHSKLVLEKQIASYVAMASDPSLSPSMIAMLESEILSAQGDLISMQANMSRFEEISGRYAQGSTQLLTGLESFLGSWSGEDACLSKKGPLLNSLLSNSLLVTGAFASPGTALALGAASVITTSVGKFLRDFKTNNQLKAYDDIKMPTAIRCVTSVMADQYCGIEDTKRLIDIYREDEVTTDSKFEGIDLLDEHMRNLGHWLQEAYAGSAITSEGDLVNREKPILQAELLKKVRRYLQTYGTIRTKLYTEISSERDRSNAVAIGITALVSIMEKPSLKPKIGECYGSGCGSSGVENPIFISRSKKVLPYSILGDQDHINVPNCPADSDRACSSLQAYVNDRGITLTMGTWSSAIANSLGITDEVLEIVNAERARTISVDAYSVLARANADIHGETNAFRGLIKVSENATRIANYLTELGCELDVNSCLPDGTPKFRHRYYPQIVNTLKTKKLTDKVIDLIEEGFIPRTMPAGTLPQECVAQKEKMFEGIIFDEDEDQKAFTVTSCITKILKLAERGNDVYFSKVRSMVSSEIEARFSTGGDFGRDIDDIIRATRGDLVQSLQSTYGGSDVISLPEVYLGLETAQSMIKNTTVQFTVSFDKHILNALTKMRITKEEKSALCFSLLPYAEYKKNFNDTFGEKFYGACKSAKMSFYKNGPKLVWSDFVAGPWKTKKSITERFCALRNYNRNNKLYRKQNGRKSVSLIE
jgi:hypothetical protein